MSLKEFLFPKNFHEEVIKSQRESARKIELGKQRMRSTRGEKWYNFFMWLPFVGNAVFMREGTKAQKEMLEKTPKRRKK